MNTDVSVLSREATNKTDKRHLTEKWDFAKPDVSSPWQEPESLLLAVVGARIARPREERGELPGPRHPPGPS